MKCQSVVFVLCMFLPWISTQLQSCITPLGVTSQCIVIYECSPLLEVLMLEDTLKRTVIDFMRQSHCGFEGSLPKVCCGPLPSNTNSTSQTNTELKLSVKNSDYMDPFASINIEDSQPATIGQCGLDTIGDRILGGSATDLDEFPWIALLCYRTRDDRISCVCGGALINHRYVITAAHCLIGAIETKVGQLKRVRLGEYNLDTSVDCLLDACADLPQEISVEAAYPHPDYKEENENKNNDIGLVRLTRRAIFSYYVQPICLPDSQSRQNVGTSMVVAGWGRTTEGRSSSVKMKLSVPIYDHTQCIQKYETIGLAISEEQICAGGNFREDSCSGDSGGPLMNRRRDSSFEIVGIVSFGIGCGRRDWPGIYTSVVGYLDWILQTLRSTNV